MSEVNGRAFRMLLSLVERQGLSADELVRGLPITVGQLRRARRHDFGLWTQLIERLTVMLGGLEELERFGAGMAVMPFPHDFRRVARLIASPTQLYKLNSRWAVSAEFRGLESTCVELPDGRLQVTMAVDPGERSSMNTFVLAGGVLRGLPGTIGLPPAQVEAHVGSHAGTYLIRPPRPATLWHRAGLALGAFAGARAALAQLGEQQQEIVSQNRTLERQLGELRRADKELRGSEERWRALATSLPAQVLVVEADGRVSMSNRGGELPAELAPALARARAGETVGDLELASLVDGRPRWTLARLAPFGDGRLIVLLTDITGRRQAELDLRSSEERLARAQKLEALGRLAGGIAHDFNNLLTIMLSCSELVLARDPGPEIAADLGEIQGAAQRGAELTRQLLALSRQELHRPRVIDLNKVVGEAERMLRRVVAEDVGLVVRLAADLGNASLDPGQIHQVILNLALNARDAMPSGGELVIATENVQLAGASELDLPPGAYVRLSVRDSGSGMSATTMSHLYEPFYTTKGAGRGTGLGLSIVRGIVQQNAGGISCTSQVGGGTTFQLYFPRVTQPASRVERALPAPGRTGHETILLAEDDAAVRRATRTILTAHGYHVLEAASAREALRLADEHVGTIDLLLSDVVMPEQSGLELSRELRRGRPGVRVLFISGYAEHVIASRGVLADGVSVLQKPFAAESLVTRVRQTLDAS